MDYKRNIVQANKREVKIVNEFISFGVSIPCIINTSHVHYVRYYYITYSWFERITKLGSEIAGIY